MSLTAAFCDADVADIGTLYKGQTLITLLQQWVKVWEVARNQSSSLITWHVVAVIKNYCTLAIAEQAPG